MEIVVGTAYTFFQTIATQLNTLNNFWKCGISKTNCLSLYPTIPCLKKTEWSYIQKN